ncbi:putative 3-oxoacyl-(acyl-carrier-protein) reductase (3-ketoacyl-acyl carrier protein reductase) [Xenorhabdus bovienii str. oregonense]|uniref:Putative 3-oxoacyl-(Acyl-carrier-protein) reductase (3-ketoacyl-acyl carrier protein reductase) n=1 Tax=Xenorhabdus bovienii str. oregonense TaxID=1398202 RepID=A0A077NTD7_XENBV|nr:SDR family oxidoreductase [Xenorhabdus bovienii]CDH05452.1 putative 3-oxoacyl-(acyl-carrier-protein) reductase (3-ketoacyl-acyl carrier protein reductase) [Xenorhabdus bovienii str. oregonense]
MLPPKTVVISGGSKGLGSAMVSTFLNKGYRVATFSRQSNEFIVQKQLSNDDFFYWESVDVNYLSQIKSFISSVNSKFGHIDILINNIAKLSEGLLVFSSDRDIISLLNTNILAPIILTRECSKGMLKRNAGIILNISSINSIKGHKGVSLYSATKAAIDGITRSLAREFGPANIRVNSLVPGFFDSDMVSYLSENRRKQILKRTPIGRLSKIEEISKVALFICSDDAAFITGQNIIVDGGMSC